MSKRRRLLAVAAVAVLPACSDAPSATTSQPTASTVVTTTAVLESPAKLHTLGERRSNPRPGTAW